MKRSVFILMGFLAFSSYGIHWEIVGQESQKPVYSGKINVDLDKSVGFHTLAILRAFQIPYNGTEEGIHSILKTPTGDDAIVMESDRTMRVYGWCFTIDEVQSTDLPHQTFFRSQESVLRWYFAYAVNKNGQWTDYCTPAYLNPLR